MIKKILEVLLGSLKGKIITGVVTILVIGGAIEGGIIYSNSISSNKVVSMKDNKPNVKEEENINSADEEVNNSGTYNNSGSTTPANNGGSSNSGGSMTPEPPKQNYDEVTMITYQAHTGNINLTSNQFDKEYDNALTKVSIESNRNDLLSRTCDDLAKEMVSLEDARNIWGGKYVDNKYKVKSLKMYSVNIKSKSVEESTDKYINRIKTSNLFSYSPSSSIYFDKVRHYGNLNNDSIAVIKRVIIEFERI